MCLTIRHQTRYTFAEPVKQGLQHLRKTPKSSHQKTVLNWNTHVTGGHRELSFEDQHSNTVELIGFERDTHDLTLISEGEVELSDNSGIVGQHRAKAPL